MVQHVASKRVDAVISHDPGSSLKFIDLFAGLGGFHVALKALGHECVYACEIAPDLSALYEANFGIRPVGDIREAVASANIPDHDILCAGFPCQPFSKAGEQQGLDCDRQGRLIESVIEILRTKRPKYFILENVPNFLKHNKGRTFRTVASELRVAGYSIDAACLSPHQFGIPQTRERLFIVGSAAGLQGFAWPAPTVLNESDVSIKTVLDVDPAGSRRISAQAEKALAVWQEFLNLYPADKDMPWYPIWAMEFGANYPIRESVPANLDPDELARYKGAFGIPLKYLPPQERIKAIPSYAANFRDPFPDWKINFIQRNRDLFDEHSSWITKWMGQLGDFPASFQKLEWNMRTGSRSIYDHIIQFRGSGIRVKATTAAPSLVAMTTSQVPVIGWEKRYMTPRECSRLQGLQSLSNLPESSTAAYKALGNAVNTELVRMLAERLTSASLRSARAAGSRPENVLLVA